MLYENPVPSGQLPLDMPTADFVREAEDLLGEMPLRQHFACSLFKRRLLQCMECKFPDQPKFRLFYVRTLLEVGLHELMWGNHQQVVQRLRDIIERMVKCQV